MAGGNRALSFTFTTDDQQALAALRRMEKGFKGLDVQVDRTRQTGLNFGNSMAGLAVGAGLIFATNEFEEAEKGLRATEAVIKSTGNAAEVSAEQQAKMVDELSRLAGVDDDIVNAGANMLRTFTSIKGENFGVALAASMDLAAFKGQDLASTAEQVGKALNDPLAGMGKLAKQGVVLSEVQKQQIRDFMAVGDVASAQGVILKELETEYGGQAEAAATSSGKMKVALGEAAESAGAVLAPAVQFAADGVGALSGAFQGLPRGTQTAALALGAVAVVAKKAEGAVGGMDGGLRGLNTSLSGVDKALIGATAGLAAFSTATAFLENSSKFGGDMAALGTDLEQLAGGSATADQALTEVGGSLDELATKFKLVADNNSLFDAAAGVAGFLQPGAVDTGDIVQAKNDIDAVDKALAEMVASGNAEGASAAYLELSQALIAQGVPAKTVTALMDDYWVAQERAGRGTKETTDAVEESAGAFRTYSDDVAEAIDKAKDINDKQRAYTDAQGDTTDAYADLAEAQAAANGNSDEYAQSLQDIRDAENAVADAAKSTQKAQEDLTQARKDAAETLDDLRRSAEGSVLSEEAAQISLEEAKLNKRKVDRDKKSTPLEKRKANLDLREAELALRDAQDRRQDSAQELAQADANGIENAPNVVAAKDAVASALDNQRTAERNVATAARDSAQIITDAKAKVGDASKALDGAIRNEADAHKDAADAIYGAAGGNSVYLETLKKQAEMLAPGSPLRVALESYIEDVERLAGTVVKNPPASAQPGGGSTGTIGYYPPVGGDAVPSGDRMGNDLPQTGGDPAPTARQTNANLTMNVGTINVGGTARDMDAAIDSAGRKLGRKLRAA